MKSAIFTCIIALALIIAIAFFDAAIFIGVAREYGPIIACLTLGGFFIGVALIAFIFYLRIRRIAAECARENAQQVSARILSDPIVLMMGFELAKKLGTRGLLPLIGVIAAATGVFRSHKKKPSPEATSPP